MRYLKRFDEELKTQTYKSAAAGLKKLGHTKRADDLNAWADTTKEKEEARKLKEMIDLYSKHGVFKVDLSGVIGNFYLWFGFDEHQNNENWQYWHNEGRFEGNRLWMTLDICLYPADQETFEKCVNKLDFYPSQPYYASTLGLKLSDPVDAAWLVQASEEDLPYESGQWELVLKDTFNMSYMEGNECSLKFVNRVEAMKFRKLAIDVLEGNVEMGETSTNPGGVKEKIIDFYCNKIGVSIEEFDNFVDAIRGIKVNSFYRD
jgi:hypothetical protein